MTAGFSSADVVRFRDAVGRRLGFHYDDDRLENLADVLRGRLQATGAPALDAYLDGLAGSGAPEELRVLSELLTVGETFFFRNPDNFRAMAEAVLPARIRARASQRRLTFLSAGCASGEEPFTIAIQLREAFPELANWDVQIVALDLNRAALAKAQEGLFSAWSLRATPEAIRRRYFRPVGRSFALDPAIGEMVRFAERNLVEPDPSYWRSLGCDAIFCRNVIMYFRPEVMAEVVERLRSALAPGGYLFLGHAETLRGLTHHFHLRHTHDTFYYQLREGTEASHLREEGQQTAWTAAVEPGPSEAAVSWVDAIGRASERIASLAEGRRGFGAPERAAPTPRAEPRSSWDLALVLEAMRQERFSQALELISSLPPAAGSDPEALLLRAALLTNAGRIPEAEAACQALLELDDLHAGAHYLMALCREHHRDRAGTLEHDEAAAYLDPAFAMPHLHMGLLARKSGDPGGATRELSRAMALLAREDDARLLLFGGGFSREALLHLCGTELRAAGGGP